MKTLVDYINENLNERYIGEEINIVIGRFQPFTLGHAACAKFAADTKHVKSVLCVIDTKKADEKHPFLTNDMFDYFDKIVMYDKNITGWVRVTNADLVKNTEILRAKGYEPVSWSCGTDRYDKYKRELVIPKYLNMAGLPEDFELLEIKRGDEDISATKVREALKNGDIKTYQAMTPKYLHGTTFDMLRDLINKVK